MHQPPLRYDRKKYNTIHPGMLKKAASKAAASEEARRTLRYVEPLNDARTPLVDFFSILPVEKVRACVWMRMDGHGDDRTDWTIANDGWGV